MKKRDWLIWLLTVLFLVSANTVPLRFYWKTAHGSLMGYRGTLFEIIRYFITEFFIQMGKTK